MLFGKNAAAGLINITTAPGGLIEAINGSNGVLASPKNTSMATDIRNTNSSDVYGVSLKAEIDLGGGYLCA